MHQIHCITQEHPWGHGHCISSEFCINNIDGFEAVLRKMISSLKGLLRQSVTVVASYVFSPYFMLPSPLCAKWNMETLTLKVLNF